MNFIINYPSEIIQPKGLHVPSQEDVQQAVKLAEIVAGYIDIGGYEDDEEFEIAISDEIIIHEGKLVDANTSEGVRLHPSASPWTVESVFGLIISALFGEKESPRSAIAISVANLTEIAEEMKILINFIWGLQNKLPLVRDFCNEHEYIMDTSISLTEKIS